VGAAIYLNLQRFTRKSGDDDLINLIRQSELLHKAISNRHRDVRMIVDLRPSHIPETRGWREDWIPRWQRTPPPRPLETLGGLDAIPPRRQSQSKTG
jgi:hypothetical protein